MEFLSDERSKNLSEEYKRRFQPNRAVDMGIFCSINVQ